MDGFLLAVISLVLSIIAIIIDKELGLLNRNLAEIDTHLKHELTKANRITQDVIGDGGLRVYTREAPKGRHGKRREMGFKFIAYIREDTGPLQVSTNDYIPIPLDVRDFKRLEDTIPSHQRFVDANNPDTTILATCNMLKEAFERGEE